MTRRSAVIRCLPLCLVLSAASCTDAKHPKAPARTGLPPAAPKSSVPAYAVTDLGTLPGYNISAAYSINDRGQVVGVCIHRKNPKVIGDDPIRAFEWQGGRLRGLGGLSHSRSSAATSINNPETYTARRAASTARARPPASPRRRSPSTPLCGGVGPPRAWRRPTKTT